MSLLRPIGALVAGLGAFALLGCASVYTDQALMFKETQRRYTHLVRFADWERAERFVAPDERSAFRERAALLGDLRFSEFEIREVENLGETASAHVEYTGFRDSDPVVVTFFESQQWEQLDGAWVVRPSFSERRQ